MNKGKCNAHPRESNDVIHLRRNPERPKCKINYGLRRKSTLIEQNQQRRNSPRSYTIREDLQTTWLSNENEVIGIEKKYIKEMDININDFFILKPEEPIVQNTEIESQISVETLKPMERISVSDVCKVVELQSGLSTANNVMDCLIDHRPAATHSEMSVKQRNPLRKFKSINEKLFGNDNFNEIDYGQVKKLKGSRRIPATLPSGRVIRRGLTELPTKKRDSPRKIFLAKNQPQDKKKMNVDLNPLKMQKDRENKSLYSLKQNMELAEEQLKQRELSSMNQKLNKRKENLSTECDHKVVFLNGSYDLSQSSDKYSYHNQSKVRNSDAEIIDASVHAINEAPERNVEPKVDQVLPLEQTCQLSTDKEKKPARPMAAVEPKYLPKNYRFTPSKKKTTRKYYVSFKKNQLPQPKRAKILKAPKKAQKIDVNLENLGYPQSEQLSSLIPYNMETSMETNIVRESAMRTTVLVERAQHLRQEYDKRLLIDQYLDAMPEELTEVEAELAKTICAFPKNQIQEIDRCPCGMRISHCREIMYRPTWFDRRDSLTKWLLSTPPAVLISIFIICIFSICVLKSENPKPMTTWEYMKSSFKKEFKKPTKIFRSNFF